MLFQVHQKGFIYYFLPGSLKIFINVFAFLYGKANSKEICEEIFFFFRKMLMSAILLRFYANFLKKCVATSVWIPIALATIYFLRMVLYRLQKPFFQ